LGLGGRKKVHVGENPCKRSGSIGHALQRRSLICKTPIGKHENGIE